MLSNLFTTNSTMKFYNIDVPEQVQTTSQPSIAELLARQGNFRTDEGYSDSLSDVHKVAETIPPTATEPPSVAQTTETQQAETASQSTPTPETVVTKEPEQIVQTPEVAQPTWQEVLKQQPDQRLVLNELGYDDNLVSLVQAAKEKPEIVTFFQHWINGGDPMAILKEATTDYSKMPAEEVMRHQLRQEYPKANPQALEALYKAEVVRAYGLDSDDEEVIADGRLLLEAKADRYRDKFIENQKNYLVPKPPEPKVSEPDNTEEIKAQQEAEAVKSFIKEHAYTKDVVSNNRIVIGEGEDRFTYPIAASEVLDLVMDSEKWASTIYTKTEKGFVPKVEEQLLIGAFAQNPKKFLNEYAKHLKALGGQEAIAPIENASQTGNSTPSKSETVNLSPAAAMGKFGRLV